MDHTPASLARMIAEYRRHTESEEYTDTGDVWELLTELETHLEALSRPLSVQDLTICPTPEGGALVRPGGGPYVEDNPPIATFTRRADAELFVAAMFAPPLERTRELVDTLAGALQSCEHQMSQMEGMFDDSDGTIAQAFEDAEHAQACVKAWRDGEPLPPPPASDDDEGDGDD